LPIHKNSLFNYLDLPSETKDDRVGGVGQSLNTMTTLEETLCSSYDWAIDRIHFLCDKNEEHDYQNAYSIQQEFSEWLNPNIVNHDVVSLQYIGD
jgi:hypothetical protein